MLVRQKNGASGQMDVLYPSVMGKRNGWLAIVGITLEVHTARADGIVYAWHLHGIILEMYSRMVVLTILRAFLLTTVIS